MNVNNKIAVMEGQEKEIRPFQLNGLRRKKKK